MTNSFFNSSLGINTSKTNYLQTEVDMTEAVNKQIDDNIKMMNNHYDQLIKMSNDSHKARSNAWKELAAFTKDGAKLANWAIARAEAKAAINNYYDVDKYQHRWKHDQETDELEAELDAQTRINYTAAGEIESYDPELSSILKMSGQGKAAEKELYSLALGQSGEFYERAVGTLQVEVEPGVWKTMSQAENAAERAIISKEIDEVFITAMKEQGQGLNDRLMEKYLIKPMLEQHKQRLTVLQAESTKARADMEVDARRKLVIDGIKLEGGKAIEKYLQDFNGYHSASSGLKDKGYYLAKQELTDFLVKAVENGEIDPEDMTEALQFKLTPKDGGPPRSIEEYLPQIANPVKKAVNKAALAKVEQAKVERELAIRADVDPILKKWREEGPPDEEEIHKAIQDIASKHGEVPNDLANYASKQDIADADIEFELNERWSKTGEIFIEDLDGISDANIKAKWLQRVNEGGLSSKEITRRDASIKTLVNDRTFEQDADKEKTFKWDTIYNNALEKYDEVYRSERSQGQNHRTAKSIALKETRAYIQTDAAEIRNWEPRDDTKADNINSARAAILKDNSVIDSPDLWKGEEAELKAALRYINTGKGGLPQYYKSFPFINLTPYELMQRRLAATGIIKPSEVKPIPERELQPETQDLLLNKPSPSRTIRALNSGEDMTSSLEATSYEDTESLVSDARSRAERNNQTAGWEIALVNIDPALEEEHTQVVGEQSTFMRLPTMLPGVAMAYVEDKYNV